MSSKSFLISVGAAVAALFTGQTASKSEAVANSANTPQTPETPKSTLAGVVGQMLYEIGPDQHALVLKKSETGSVYAQHRSHASHGSHGSHGSHRSGY
jgi:hypothetical protein